MLGVYFFKKYIILFWIVFESRYFEIIECWWHILMICWVEIFSIILMIARRSFIPLALWFLSDIINPMYHIIAFLGSNYCIFINSSKNIWIYIFISLIITHEKVELEWKFQYYWKKQMNSKKKIKLQILIKNYYILRKQPTKKVYKNIIFALWKIGSSYPKLFSFLKIKRFVENHLHLH